MESTKSKPRLWSRSPGWSHRSVAGSALTLLAATVLSCATPLEAAHAQPLQSQRGAYEVEVLVDGQPSPRFFHAGETYVLGQQGERYTLRVWNRSPQRIEAVVSVDGRDVIDGKSGDFRHKRGYLVPAWGSVDIDGWRLSQRQAAAFRFTSVADSYAGRMGSPRNVGVIGVAVFPERTYHRQPVVPHPRPYSWRHPAPGRGAGADEAREESVQHAPSPSSAPAEADDAGQGALAGSNRSAGAAKSAPPSASRARPGLGTQFGESLSSPIREVHFARANASSPAAVLGLRYNDRAGLLAMGVDVDGYGQPHDAWLRGTADPFPVSHRRYAAPPAGWQR